MPRKKSTTENSKDEKKLDLQNINSNSDSLKKKIGRKRVKKRKSSSSKLEEKLKNKNVQKNIKVDDEQINEEHKPTINKQVSKKINKSKQIQSDGDDSLLNNNEVEINEVDDEIQKSKESVVEGDNDSKLFQNKSCHNIEIGKKGENAAAKFLQSKGYDIICRNWACPIGEADIIARCEDTLVFVEVKTRTNIKAGLPEDAVNAKKRKKYECIAAMYLQDNDYTDMPVRFDVIAILVIKSDKALIRHHVNAFGVG